MTREGGRPGGQAGDKAGLGAWPQDSRTWKEGECLGAPGRLVWGEDQGVGSPGLPAHARSSAGRLSGFLHQMGRGVLFLLDPNWTMLEWTLLPGTLILQTAPSLWLRSPRLSGTGGRVTGNTGRTVNRRDRVTVQRGVSELAEGSSLVSSPPCGVTEPPLCPVLSCEMRVTSQ